MNKAELIQKLFDKGIYVTKEMIENGLNEDLLKEVDDVSIVHDQDSVTVMAGHEVVTNFENEGFKYKVQDFQRVFTTRYHYLHDIIRTHNSMKNIMSIQRLQRKKDKEQISVIGMVSDIGESKNGNLIITIEDPQSSCKAIVMKDKDVFEHAKDILYDEVIGVTGTGGDGVVFVDDIIWPDIPHNRQMKYAPVDENVVFISDVHVGSDNFMHNEFVNFISWLNGEYGDDDQKQMAKKVKYLFIAGDCVDGIGIYPKQQEELDIDTMSGQYEAFADYLKKIPSHIQIFICPGNHDVVHLAEPQPVFYKKYTQSLHDMPNVHLVSNPSMISIGKTEDFSGINVLMYHGYSFDFYVANVDSIRNGGGYKRADLIQQFLLKRRHLAPAFKSTPYLPAYQEDPLLIRTIPDIMITGHIHYSSVANYRGVTMMSGSCWQACTKFQEKLGHEPEPGMVPVVNLKTREVNVLNFL